MPDLSQLMLLALAGFAVYHVWPLLVKRSTAEGVPSRAAAHEALGVVKRRLLAAGHSVEDTSELLDPVAFCLDKE